MAFLSNASTLYLDDETDNLANVEDRFRRNGWYIETTQSIEQAKAKALAQMDIFICDQRLPHISESLTGAEILKDVRKRNKNVFLALYTAYHKDIAEEDIQWFKDNNIKIYEKTDDDIFLLSLENDYSSYMYLKDKQSEIFDSLKTHVVNHLRGISNQQLPIYIPGHKSKVPVKQLITEVLQTTPIGVKYIEEWLDTKSIIQTIRQNNNHV